MRLREVFAKTRAALTAASASLALRIQEAQAYELSNNDVCARLRDCVRDCFRGTGTWAYYIDHFGDSESGDVVYCANDDCKRAPYSMTMANGRAACTIDFDAAVDVVPRTVYEEEAEDEDHYASLEADRLYNGDAPLYERFISKDERKAAGSGSFAGKGKSFPILKPADVMAAVRAIGRAGSENYDAGTLKRNIIKIAKAKGWEKELPKAWRSGDSSGKESAGPVQGEGGLRLVESSAFAIDIPLREAVNGTKKIKLITPGKGSSAYYTEEVLKRDGPLVFKAGTPMRIDHPTKSEEAERPEGSVKDWGAVLAQDAFWMESGPQGKGLYSSIKPFSDHAPLIEEKGPYAGVSIAAWGDVLVENGKQVIREGVPVLARLTRADGVDMVTRAGAGGLFLSEAARPANSNQEVSEVDAADLKKLNESLALREANEKKLLERALRSDARELAIESLKGLSLNEAARDMVIENVLGTRENPRPLPIKENELDTPKLKELLEAEAKRVGAFVAHVTGSGAVRGFGVTSAPAAAVAPEVSAQESERQKAAGEQRLKETIQAFRDMGMPEDAAKRAAMKGAA